MKKLFPLLLFITLGFFAKAQSVTLTLITSPCDSNGVVVATFSGITPPIYSEWYSSWPFYVPFAYHTVTTGTTDTLYGFAGGFVGVTIDGWTQFDSATYNAPFAVSVSATSAACPASGSLSATVSGGTGPFTYKWENASTYSVVATTNPTSITTTGYYIVRVTDVGTGCISGFDAGANLVTISPDFTQTVTSTGAICTALGTATVSITGGTPPFTYVWNNASTGATAGTGSPVGLPYGLYGETTTDAAGCIYNYGDSINIQITPDFTQTVTTAPAVCPALGSGIVNVSGGTSPFSYSWTNVYTSVITTTSTSPTNLPTGPYNEITTDAFGCSVGSSDLAVTYTPDFSGVVTTTPANCSNGTASVAITSGIPPYSYLWSNGATTDTITGLVTNEYYVRVIDATGCSDTSFGSGYSLSGFVPQAVTISAPDVTTPATCIATNGSITAFGSGGTPPYSYLWSNGGTTQTISGLSSNYYSVTVTDANGCIGTGGDNVTSSTPISVTYSTTASSCTSPTGTATLAISGGTLPYAITWYTTPTQTSTTATSLPPGNYYFTIVDAMGCMQSGTVTVPPVDVISLSFGYTAATCAASDGSIAVYAAGGVTPYTYSWTPGTSTTNNLNYIPYGTYSATVTDAHGCSITKCQLVPYTSPLELGLSTTEASCLYTSDGTITEVASLGTPPYAYSLGGSSSGAVTVTGKPTGPYWITVTDALGCTAENYTYVDYNIYDSSCFCEVNGKVYNDLALTCSPTGDPGIQNIQLQASGFGYTYSNDSGNYYFLLPTGTYTLSQTVKYDYPLSPCQLNHIPVTVVAATGCYQTFNFADTMTPIHDMHICTWDYSMPIPGFFYTQTTIVSNHGTVTEPDILASYTPDGQLYSPTFVPSGIFSGAPYYYSTPASVFSLAPGASQQFLMSYNVPTDIPLGTNVIFKDTAAYAPPISNWLDDYSPWDNVDYFTTTTVGSYDPNFKEVSPKGTGTQGFITPTDTVLEYMVHFQNIGTYMAQNVVVKDTLDPNLDWSTLTPEYMSGQCAVDMDDSGRLTFTFSNIDLPPASSEPITSNGLLTYSIRVKHGLAYGVHMRNSASIYFDYNAPVKTNTTLTTIGGPTKTPTVPGNTAVNSFTIFPNPAQNSFTAIINIDNAGAYNLRILDITGKTDISKPLSLQSGAQNISINTNSLAPGMYFVTLTGNNVTQTQKLVIIK